MTDTTTPTPQTTMATTPADSPAPASAPVADAAAPAKDSNTPPDGAVKAQPSSPDAQPAPEWGAPAADKKAQATNDGNPDPNKAQDGDATPDKSKPDGQSSDAEKPKDGEGEEGKTDALAYQPSDFVMPEGMELDADAFAAAAPVLKELNVPKEAAQKLVDVAASMVSKAVKTATDAHLQTVENWGSQTKAEFGKGGEAAFDKERAIAQAAINRFMSEDERQQLQHYGLGNFPAVFRMAHALGTMMAEDNLSLPNGQGGGKEETLAEVWYPTKQT